MKPISNIVHSNYISSNSSEKEIPVEFESTVPIFHNEIDNSYTDTVNTDLSIIEPISSIQSSPPVNSTISVVQPTLQKQSTNDIIKEYYSKQNLEIITNSIDERDNVSLKKTKKIKPLKLPKKKKKKTVESNMDTTETNSSLNFEINNNSISLEPKVATPAKKMKYTRNTTLKTTNVDIVNTNNSNFNSKSQVEDQSNKINSSDKLYKILNSDKSLALKKRLLNKINKDVLWEGLSNKQNLDFNNVTKSVLINHLINC